MATFVNDLRLTELATGEGSGTWGTTTNTNLELIAESFSFGTEAITTNADTHTTTIADGSTDPGRSLFLKYTGTLDSACTITIGPNTVSKLWFIENATSGSQSIIISQGSGANITIPNGQTKAIYSDGAGSGAAMVDAFQDLSIPDLFVDDDLTVGDDLILSSDSAVITFGADGDTTLTHTDGSGLTLNSTNKIMFNDASQFIQGSSATVLSLGATDEIDLTATAIDVNGTIDVSGNATFGGTLGVNSGTTNTVATFTSTDAGSGIQLTDSTGSSKVETNGANLRIGVDDDGAVADSAIQFRVDGSTKAVVGATSTVFNEGSADLDFRVESDNNANMLLVNAGNDRVGIGVDPGTAQFEVLSASNQIVAHFAHPSSSTSTNNGGAVVNVQNTNSTNGNMSSVIFRDSNNNASSGIFGYNSDHSDGEGLMTFGTRNSSGTFGERVRIASNGGVGIGVNPTDGMDANIRYLHIGEQSIFRAGDTDFTDATVVATNLYQTGGTDKYIVTGAASSYAQQGGSHFFSSAASGSANDSATMINTFQMTTSEAAFNDGSADIDFRVESDGNSHMLFVDAGNDHVNIGTSSDFGGVLNVNGGAVFDDATTLDPDTMGNGRLGLGNIADGGGFASPGLGFGGTGGNTAAIVNASGTLFFGLGDKSNADSLKSMIVASQTSVSVNEDSLDADFRVESNSNTHMLFVDGGMTL